MLPETYMSKASLDKVVADKQVTLLERIHAKVDQIRYLLVKFHHTHGKPATYRLWKLAKYEMRKLKVDDIDKGELFTLLDTLKGAKTHDEAIAVLKKRYGGGYEAKAKQLVGEIRQRIDHTLKQWAQLTQGALTDRTLAPWKDYVPKPTVEQVKKMEEQAKKAAKSG
ncbi:MAG: hypothetical protein D6776_02955 [Planctomycetota bacterium]|nr:MAG: hypothetical protein D6776_02955 [Planctomycetota bacterium]